MCILVCTWTGFVCTVLRLPSILRTQITLEEERENQDGDLKTNSLPRENHDNPRDNNHSVLCIEKKYIMVYTSMYMYVPQYLRYILIPWY